MPKQATQITPSEFVQEKEKKEVLKKLSKFFLFQALALLNFIPDLFSIVNS